MSKVVFDINKAGVRQLLKSDGAKTVCKEYASRIAARAGEGYVMEDRNYPERAGAAVRVDSHEAYRDNLENNTLLKSLY